MTQTLDVNERRSAHDDVVRQLQTLHEQIGDGEPDEAQQSAWEDLETREAQIREDLAHAEEAQRRAARVAASRAKWGATQISPNVEPEPSDAARLSRGQARSQALKLLDDRDNVRHLGDAQIATVERLLRADSDNCDGTKLSRLALATENPAYRSGFRKYLARGATATLSVEEANAVNVVNEVRAMNITTDSAGGFGLPVLIDPTILLSAQGTPNDFFAISRVEQITTDEWKGVSSAGMSWYWTTEGVASTDGSPTLAQPTVVTKKVTGWIPYSVEVGGDYPNFASEMSRLLLSGYSEKIVEGLTVGTGAAAQPTGVVTALEATTASQVAVSSDGNFLPADVYALWAALPVRFRGTSRWMSSVGVMNALRQFGTTVGSEFTVNLLAQEVPALFGRPYHVNEYMDAPVTATTGAASLMIVGDWSNFLIAQRVGMTVEVVQHVMDTTTGTPTGQRGLWAWARIGSNVVVPEAFRVLSQS